METLNFETEIKAFTEFPGVHYIEVSKELMEKIGTPFRRRIVCNVNGLKYQCAIQSLGNGAGWISINKARLKELDISLGSEVLVSISEDKSKYGLPMPKELLKVLREDKEGSRRFELLTPGKKRNILHYVGNHKKTEQRLKRAKLVVKNLKKLKEGKETAAAIFGLKSKFNRQS